MRKIIITLSILTLSFTTTISSAESGIVNFNLGKSPVNDPPVQSATLLGCNTVVNTDLFWNTDNQIVGNIPYGEQKTESGTPYHVNKYYVVSPPAFRKGSAPNSDKQRPFIGLVTPDRFTFRGDKPAQIVYFDYRILKPTYLTHVQVDYSHKNNNGNSCTDLKVDLVPINTHCKDFQWRNGALGGAGIGTTTQANNKIFLPLEGEKKTPLHCEVTILDDILLEHKIHFVSSSGEKTKTADLTQYHKNNEQLKLVCETRPANALPPGCLP